MILTKLKPHQRRAALHVFVKRQAALIMGKGVGKTLTILKAVEMAKPKRLVVLTNSAASVTNWQAQIGRHTDWWTKNEGPIVIGTTCSGGLMIATYHGTKRVPNDVDMLVCDESHAIKNRRAGCSKRLLKLSRDHPESRRVIMTATPASLNPMDLWAQYAFLGLHPLWGEFSKHYCIKGGFMNKAWLLRKEKLDQYMREVAAYTFYQSEDILNLQDHTNMIIPVDLPEEVRTSYDTLTREFILEFAHQGKTVQQLTPNTIVKMVKLHQLCGGTVRTDMGDKCLPSAKLDWVIDYVLSHNHKTVIFCAYNAEVRLICETLEKHNVTYRSLFGDNRDKSGWISFQHDPNIQVMVCQFRSGSQSIDLHAAHVSIYYSSTFHYIDFDQSIGRIRRMGQPSPTRCYFLQATNTIDELIYANLHRKGKMLQAVFKALVSPQGADVLSASRPQQSDLTPEAVAVSQ